MIDRIKHRILSHVADRRYEPRQWRHLAHELGIPPEQHKDFQASVDELVEEGKVVLGAADTVVLPPPGAEVIGTFRKARGGFGFVVADSGAGHGDLFVPAPATLGALTGDKVRTAVTGRPRRGGAPRYEGRIVEILQRAERRFVGNLMRRGSGWVVRVDGRHLHDPVVVRDPHARNANAGDKVVVELLSYPQPGTAAEGVITEVLGEHGNPDVETKAVMRAHGLVDAFPAAVLNEASRAGQGFVAKRDPSRREDLTGIDTLTIDPPDARDFDDAISLKRLQEGGKAGYELGVHIADVSHFVNPGSELDREASARGNSVYLPRHVIPMLPEVLSNGVCSLQENVERLCMSAFIRFDDSGRVCHQRFARTIIRSDKRLTYLEAQALIDGDKREARKHARTETTYPRGLVDQLKLLDELARIIRKRRLKEGMIVLSLPQVELVFDDEGRVADAVPEDNAFTHTIIEMFMVEANEAAARLFHSFDVPMIRRVHADPRTFDVRQLRQFARVAGYTIPEHPTRADLRALLDATRGQPAQHAVHLAVLKTLSRAEYSPALVGHFALASEHYTHFTSPIRRYADLIVHRGLGTYLDLPEAEPQRKTNRRTLGRAWRDNPDTADEEKLIQIGRHCSVTERNAEAAERDLRDYLVLELLSRHLGDQFEGTVTGVTGSGIFVQLDRYLIDGFISVADLTGGGRSSSESWRLDRATGTLVEHRRGRTISIGDRMTVRVARVEPSLRRLDLVIIDAAPTGDGQKKRSGPRAAERTPAKAGAVKPKKSKKKREQMPKQSKHQPQQQEQKKKKKKARKSR
jgi:ribonuclease R